jgi:hypothetical protein
MWPDESTFCLQCWHIYSLHFGGRRAEHRSQQRRYRCGDRNRLSDLVIQAAATHLRFAGTGDKLRDDGDGLRESISRRNLFAWQQYITIQPH